MRWLQLAFLSVAVLQAAASHACGSDILQLITTTVPVRYQEYEFALRSGADGVPRLDWDLYRSRRPAIVERDRTAFVLENSHFESTIIPDMGRIRSFRHKPSGREQLWINPAAIAIPAHNDTGFWVTWGGVESVLPRGEHGTSHALTWSHKIDEDSAGRKAIRMQVVEPLTRLRHTLVYAAYPDRPYLETVITIENATAHEVRFSHWTTALLAPGGTGELTPRTEFIVPANEFVAAERPFNTWMADLVGPTRTSPLRFAEGWKDIGDLMATPLKEPWYAAYCHEEGDAVVREMDLAKTPGFNIWTWGSPPNLQRQREYTAHVPNRGYVEFWNGTAPGFGDESLSVLGPGEVLTWTERMWAITGLESLDELVAEIRRENSR